jgi:hypothetical protein
MTFAARERAYALYQDGFVSMARAMAEIVNGKGRSVQGDARWRPWLHTVKAGHDRATRSGRPTCFPR